ncbi:D-aspartate oxidase [Cydia strobilella]|uniref:D-aspartate oxidase n=1 Tax=Cydia strobilella TaxID=1100964 RepID=UPI0030074760
MDPSSPKVAVLGAGVVGMTVARLIQDELRHSKVTVVADTFKDDTLSTIAAGIFRPGTSFRGPNKETTQKWIDDSWHYFQNILNTSEAVNAGIMPVSSYIFSKNNYHVTRNHLIEHLVPIYRPVDDNELNICGEGWMYGSYFSTIKTECSAHLPWLERIILEKAAKIIKGKIDNFASLSHFDLVFNCTGFGAKYLCKDNDLVPLRGQVIKVKAPWLKSAFYGDYDSYIIPGFNGIATLGGTRQYDSYNVDVCKYDAAGIMDRCCELVPGLRSAEVLAHRVGLRPHRMPVRVEPETVDGLKIVHCYGHGGYGVMTAPGTAMHAVRIGLDSLRSGSFRNKL